jgi:hypothetical protein
MTTFILLAFINFYKLLDKHLFIDVFAALGDVDENKQIEDNMAERQKVLTICFAKLSIFDVLEKLLDSLVLDKVLRDDFLLREFE